MSARTLYLHESAKLYTNEINVFPANEINALKMKNAVLCIKTSRMATMKVETSIPSSAEKVNKSKSKLREVLV